MNIFKIKQLDVINLLKLEQKNDVITIVTKFEILNCAQKYYL